MPKHKNTTEGVYAVVNAHKMATYYHEGQMYGDESYFNGHVIKVGKIVAAELDKIDIMDRDPCFVTAAALLHDTLEDTSLTRKEIRASCGPYTDELVWRLTDAPGKNRQERKAKTYPKIKADKFAVLIKMADRLANVRAGGKLDMYKTEMPDFVRGLYVPGSWESLWVTLMRETYQ